MVSRTYNARYFFSSWMPVVDMRLPTSCASWGSVLGLSGRVHHEVDLEQAGIDVWRQAIPGVGRSPGRGLSLIELHGLGVSERKPAQGAGEEGTGEGGDGGAAIEVFLGCRRSSAARVGRER